MESLHVLEVSWTIYCLYVINISFLNKESIDRVH